jgi:hypothetical protein
MFKSHIFWLKAAAVLQLLTAGAHSLSFIAPMGPENDEEKQLLDLMNGHQLNGGMGFHPTMHDLFTALSAALPALYVFAALITLHLLHKKIDIAALRGVVRINVLVFGAYFLILSALTFPPPIICTGLVFLALLGAWATMPKAT